jgi:hypothetical protein
VNWWSQKDVDVILIAGLIAQHSLTITLPNRTSWIYMVELWILKSDISSMFGSIFTAKQTHCMVCFSFTSHNNFRSQNSAFIHSPFLRVCEPQLFHIIAVCLCHLHVLLLSPVERKNFSFNCCLNLHDTSEAPILYYLWNAHSNHKMTHTYSSKKQGT